jgi:hypothetical protein
MQEIIQSVPKKRIETVFNSVEEILKKYHRYYGFSFLGDNYHSYEDIILKIFNNKFENVEEFNLTNSDILLYLGHCYNLTRDWTNENNEKAVEYYKMSYEAGNIIGTYFYIENTNNSDFINELMNIGLSQNNINFVVLQGTILENNGQYELIEQLFVEFKNKIENVNLKLTILYKIIDLCDKNIDKMITYFDEINNLVKEKETINTEYYEYTIHKVMYHLKNEVCYNNDMTHYNDFIRISTLLMEMNDPNGYCALMHYYGFRFMNNLREIFNINELNTIDENDLEKVNKLKESFKKYMNEHLNEINEIQNMSNKYNEINNKNTNKLSHTNFYNNTIMNLFKICDNEPTDSIK